MLLISGLAGFNIRADTAPVGHDPIARQKMPGRAWPAIKPCVCDENLLVWNFHGCKVRWMHSNINSRVIVDGITFS